MRHYSRALNSELSKYRKSNRISLDGSLPALPHAGQPGSRRYAGGMFPLPGRPGYHHDIYMLGTPTAYHPSLHAPAVQEDEYEPYEPIDVFHGTRLVTRRHHGPEQTIHEMPGGITVPTDDLTLTEQFLMAMGRRNEVPTGNLESPFLNGPQQSPGLTDNIVFGPENEKLNNRPSLSEVADALAQLSKVLPPDHPDLVNLRGAVQEWLGELDTRSHRVETPAGADSPQEALHVWDPQDADMMTQEMFEQAMAEVAQMQAAEGMPLDQAVAAMGAAEGMFQQDAPGGLEAIVQEAMPEQDPWEAQRQMYEEQMQMGMDPFAMPDAFGPGFGPGPMFGP